MFRTYMVLSARKIRIRLQHKPTYSALCSCARWLRCERRSLHRRYEEQWSQCTVPILQYHRPSQPYPYEDNEQRCRGAMKTFELIPRLEAIQIRSWDKGSCGSWFEKELFALILLELITLIIESCLSRSESTSKPDGSRCKFGLDMHAPKIQVISDLRFKRHGESMYWGQRDLNNLTR